MHARLHILRTPGIGLNFKPSPIVLLLEQLRFVSRRAVCGMRQISATLKSVATLKGHTDTIPSKSRSNSETIRLRRWSVVLRATGAFLLCSLQMIRVTRHVTVMMKGQEADSYSLSRTLQQDHSTFPPEPSPGSCHGRLRFYKSIKSMSDR